jgi:DNA (cytosine-5)-methyltransferase 1
MHVSVTGDVSTYVGRLAMGIDWMTSAELSQAIPPVYTEYIGAQLLDHLREAAA